MRRFALKHKYDKTIKYIFLPGNGDLLVMNDVAIKKMYKHSVQKMGNELVSCCDNNLLIIFIKSYQ